MKTFKPKQYNVYVDYEPNTEGYEAIKRYSRKHRSVQLNSIVSLIRLIKFFKSLITIRYQKKLTVYLYDLLFH